MNTHADKTQKNKKQTVSTANSQMQSNGKSTFQFVDNRPEAVVQRKLNEMMQNSPQMKKATQLQAMADEYASKQEQPIQKKENKTGLPDNLEACIENLSGYSMDDVKVHYNSDKPASLNSHAYAQGTDIHSASGQEKRLPHEAWHVIQQKQGRVKPAMQMKGNMNINDDKGLEREADGMGNKAFQMNTNTKENKSSKRSAVANSVAQKKSNMKEGFRFLDNRTVVVSNLNSGETKALIQRKKVLNVASGTNENNLLKSINTKDTTVTNLESGHMMVASVFNLIEDKDLGEVFNTLRIEGNKDTSIRINTFLRGITNKSDMVKKLCEVDEVIKQKGYIYDFSLTEAFIAEMHYLENPNEVKPEGEVTSEYAKARENRVFKFATFDEELAGQNKYDQIISVSPFGFEFFKDVQALLNRLEVGGEVIISANAKNPIWKEIFGNEYGKEIQEAILETTKKYNTNEQLFYENTTVRIIQIYFEKYNDGPLERYFNLVNADVALSNKLSFGDDIKTGTSQHTVNTPFDKIEYFAKVALRKK